MPERPGRWDLLDRPSDPVVADTAAIDEQLDHFRVLAEAMRVQGDRLARIGSGESLRGEYADELRSSATEVSKDLKQTVGRYEAVVNALREYRPAVDVALAGSASALDDAIDAAGAQGRAEAMPLAEPESGATLTPEQEAANADKVAATEGAAARLREARATLDGVLARLDEAGRAAAATVRKGFDDGLKDSGWDRFKHAFITFLKILIKVFTIIATVLAVIALVIPGVGPLISGALLAVSRALDAIAVVAEIVLVAMEGSSLEDLGFALLGLVTFGAGKVLGKARNAAPTPGSRAPSPQPTPRADTPDIEVVPPSRSPSPEPPSRTATPEPPARSDTPEPPPRPNSPVPDSAREWGVPPGSKRVDPPQDLVDKGFVKPGTETWESPTGVRYTRLIGWQGFRGSDIAGAEAMITNGPKRMGPPFRDGHDDPDWKALYVAETKDGADGYATEILTKKGDSLDHGDVVKYTINNEITLVQPPKQIGISDDPFERFPELGRDTPFVDALGDQKLIMRNPLPSSSGGDAFEWLVPWSLAGEGQVTRVGRHWQLKPGGGFDLVWTEADAQGNVTRPPVPGGPKREMRDLT